MIPAFEQIASPVVSLTCAFAALMNNEHRIVNNNADSNSLYFDAFFYAAQECDATGV